MILAQITDLHVRSPDIPSHFQFDPIQMLRNAVARLNALTPRPDAVIVTGDLVDCGRPDEYRLLAETLDLMEIPIFLVPGNHDNRDNLRAVLRSRYPYLPEAGFLNYVIEDLPLRLIGLDTTILGNDAGLLCEERLDWLAARLDEASDRPTLLFMHHPPFLTRMQEMDALTCANGDKLRALLADHPQVERVICGHVHRPIQTRWEHALVSVSPSTAHQLYLDFNTELTGYVLEPPGFQLHMWDAKDGFVSHTAPIDAFPGPFDFHPTARAALRKDLA
jgi:3',5'-cyclic AMP phosphodiesterase CpdA